MFRRHRIVSLEHEPIVRDTYGRPVGVSLPPADPPAENWQSRWLWRRALHATGELRRQDDLRSQVNALHIDAMRR